MVATLSLADFHQPELRPLFVDQLMQSLRDCGFVVIRDHNLCESLCEQAYDLTKTLFDLPLAAKQHYDGGDAGQRGYIRFGQEKAKGSSFADLKEFWHIGPELSERHPYRGRYPENVWPKEIHGFRSCMWQLYQALLSLSENILEAIALGLGVHHHYFRDMIRHGNTVQRLIHYPPLQSIEALQGVRAAAHADINLITLLLGATDAGLELKDRQGQWQPVVHKAGDIVVDTGDIMALLTNNALPATIHRVVNPEDTSKPRYSIPFFVHPEDDYRLQPLANVGQARNVEAMTAGEFLQQRLRDNGFSGS